MSLNMKKQSAEDQYLDLIIRLAFERKADLEIGQMLSAPDPELTADEKHAADSAFQRALSEEEAVRKREKRKHSAMVCRRVLLNAGKFVACLILIAEIALPVAVASSAQFRSRVMQLLMVTDTVNNDAYFSFVENKEAAFSVPEAWPGEWYPSYIP